MLSLQETVIVFNQENGNQEASLSARRWASRQFRLALKQARRQRFWSILVGKDRKLQDLSNVLQGSAIKARHPHGIHHVAIEQITGSESRSQDFDAGFFPLQAQDEERWSEVAAARYLELGLPPVDLIQVGDEYFVRDGHHRISVARALGQPDIEAWVTVWEIEQK